MAAALAVLGVWFSQHATLQTPPVMPEVQTFGSINVHKLVDGLDTPWSFAFLPNGDVLITEIAGRLRIVRNGRLDPRPIPGVPEVFAPEPLSGLMEVILHPDFETNHYVYLTYNKPGPRLPDDVVPMGWRFYLGYVRSNGASPLRKPAGERRTSTVALARGRFEGSALLDVKDIFVADDYKDETIDAIAAARMAWGRDGMLYMTIGGANEPASKGPLAGSQGGVAQDPAKHGGKVVRLRDDGSVPKDNPFVAKKGYKPEIYTMGHRNALGLAVNPATGEMWEHENGPADDDEINILKPGANYGWPLVGLGRAYTGHIIGSPGALGAPAGRKDADTMYMKGMEQPFIFWSPTVAPSGMLFYTGDKFENWKGNLLVGMLKARRIERIVFTDTGGVFRREYLLESMNKRIRDLRQGPDGYVYVLTDGNPAQLLRLER
jgi:glucose/arabinose dehydrogenase